MTSPSEKLLPTRPAPLFAKVSRETEKNEIEGIPQREEGKSEEREGCKNQGRGGVPHDNGEEDLTKKKERLDREDEETKVLLASTTGPNPNSFIAGKIQILDRESLEKMSDEAIIQRILDLQTLLTDLTYQVEAARSSNCSLQRENDDLRETLTSLRAQTEEAKRNRAYANNSSSTASTDSASRFSNSAADGNVNKASNNLTDVCLVSEAVGGGQSRDHPSIPPGNISTHSNGGNPSLAEMNSMRDRSKISSKGGGGASIAVKAFAAAEGI
ncbi:hypothetical protein CSUI_001095 [Cystoisospora suis]|uniref:Uncharacterized protein n=1 Tax=Cystoisospora suis TaxID=483139 RepID=A0A2C6LCW2_9APIC|nr:hypothetical protein CSUI_001095 [Cystoisospora suis]